MSWVVPHLKGQKGKSADEQTVEQTVHLPITWCMAISRHRTGWRVTYVWYEIYLTFCDSESHFLPHDVINDWTMRSDKVLQHFPVLLAFSNRELACFPCYVPNWYLDPRAESKVKLVQGAVSIWRCRLTSTEIPMIKLISSHDCLIFITGIPIPGKTVFILKQASVCSLWKRP